MSEPEYACHDCSHTNTGFIFSYHDDDHGDVDICVCCAYFGNPGHTSPDDFFTTYDWVNFQADHPECYAKIMEGDQR